MKTLEHVVSGATSSHSGFSKKTVLLVDKDQSFRRALHLVLTDAGYRVLSCANPGTAVRAFWARSRVDLLLTSYDLSQMTGLALASLLRWSAPNLPALIFSGAVSNSTRTNEVWQEGWCYLPRPVDRSLLLETIARQCSSYCPPRRITLRLALPTGTLYGDLNHLGPAM